MRDKLLTFASTDFLAVLNGAGAAARAVLGGTALTHPASACLVTAVPVSVPCKPNHNGVTIALYKSSAIRKYISKGEKNAV